MMYLPISEGLMIFSMCLVPFKIACQSNQFPRNQTILSLGQNNFNILGKSSSENFHFNSGVAHLSDGRFVYLFGR